MEKSFLNLIFFCFNLRTLVLSDIYKILDIKFDLQKYSQAIFIMLELT